MGTPLSLGRLTMIRTAALAPVLIVCCLDFRVAAFYAYDTMRGVSFKAVNG